MIHKAGRLMRRAPIATIALFLTAAFAMVRADASSLFEELLRESGLEFTAPAGFEENRPARSNTLFPYEHAVRSADGAIEIRYAIRPLSRIDISYQDPHSSAPHPNDLFKMLFDRITLQLAGTRDSFVNNYSPEQIVARFNAQWAAAALFDVDPRFSGEFRHGLLIAMHRDDQADAYVIGLFDDYDALRNHIGDLERSLRFTEPPAESTAAADS